MISNQVVISHLLKKRVLYIRLHARLDGLPGERKEGEYVPNDIYCPALAVDFYAIVRRSPICAKNCIQLPENVQYLKLLPSTGLLESVLIDVFGELISTIRGNQHLMVISGRFTKLNQAVSLKSISASKVAKASILE